MESVAPRPPPEASAFTKKLSGRRSEKTKGRRLALRRGNEKSKVSRNCDDDSVGTSQPSEDMVVKSEPTSLDTSLHNLTVTYHYVQSPITKTFTASTRSLSELSSALPSDGAPLQSQHQLKSSLPPPSLPSSANKHTPTSTSYRRVRKRLKIDSGSQNSVEVQRLLNIASQLCSANQTTSKPSPELVISGDSNILPTETQSPTHGVAKDDQQEQTTGSPCVEDDDAFWSQAAKVMEGEDWEDQAKASDRDNTFIDELILSGLIRTPQVCLQDHQPTPDAMHNLSPLSTVAAPTLSPRPHSTPQYSASSSSSTPLSHRSHLSAHKLNSQPLF